MSLLGDRIGDDEATLLARLRSGYEAAFRQVIDEWSPVMLRVARGYVSSRQSAEDVVQDAWLGVIRGLAGFEGRSSLRSWAFSILINRAKTRGVRESRVVASATLTQAEADTPTVDPARFQGPDGRYPGGWTSAGAPRPWDEPEDKTLRHEIVDLVGRALDQLPERQRLVVTMRDVQGLSADEACSVLGLTPQNQRVLLHRGRAALRAVLEDYYRG
ncbi:MAG TPA: sigma-70 family RNA polymerase sigma factor [Jatrophihabitantaceae bacterium]|jgi:RNA polymerase sigma-70 factor (ECF subfamily)